VQINGRALSLAVLIALSLGSASSAFAQTAPPAQPAPAPAPTPAPGEKWQPSPATAADPPLLPPPTPGAPVSTSGNDVAPPSTPAAPAPLASGAGDADARAKMRELEARVALDEARLKTLETDLGPLRHFKVQGYVQFQYILQDVNAAASPNLVNGQLPPGIGPNSVVAKADGTTTNTNLFRLRRTRLRTFYETDLLRVFIQVDVFPSGGPSAPQGTIARNAEAVGKIHWNKDVLTEVKGGLFEVPFRNELLESSMYRPFIERTWASQNLFPTERDLGVGIRTLALDNKLTTNFGILNGQRLGEPTFVLLPDLNRSKDGFAMASYKLGPVTAGLWGYLGSSQRVDTTQLRVKNFTRKGVNMSLVFDHTFFPRLGATRAIGELLFAQNMDTGVRYPFAVPAIPANFSDDVRDLNERALYLRAEQDITEWGIAGFRYDMYTTDSSIKNNARDTYNFMAGLNFTKFLRLINELSWAVDNVHPEGAAPPAKHILGYTAWLQGRFF
jgi:hypothetical protein